MISMIIGVVGSLLVILAYVNTTEGLEGWSGSDAKFLWTNLLGQSLLLVSLVFHPNLGSIFIELFLIAVTLRGLYKRKRKVVISQLPQGLFSGHLVFRDNSGMATFVSLHNGRIPEKILQSSTFVADLQSCQVYKDLEFQKLNNNFWAKVRAAFYENSIHQVFCEKDWDFVMQSPYTIRLP